MQLVHGGYGGLNLMPCSVQNFRIALEDKSVAQTTMCSFDFYAAAKEPLTEGGGRLRQLRTKRNAEYQQQFVRRVVDNI